MVDLEEVTKTMPIPSTIGKKGCVESHKDPNNPTSVHMADVRVVAPIVVIMVIEFCYGASKLKNGTLHGSRMITGRKFDDKVPTLDKECPFMWN